MLVNPSMLAGRGERLGASLIDGVVTAVVGVLFIGILGPNLPQPMGYLAFGAFLAYQLYLLATKGQTIGKQLAGIRIVSAADVHGTSPVQTVVLRTMVAQWLLSFIPFFGIVDTLFIFRDDRRCIHDLIAGTCVVQALLP